MPKTTTKKKHLLDAMERHLAQRRADFIKQLATERSLFRVLIDAACADDQLWKDLELVTGERRDEAFREDASFRCAC